MSKENSKQGYPFRLLDTFGRIWRLFKVALKEWRSLRAYQSLAPVKTALLRANLEIGKLSYHHPVYVRRVEEFNQAMIHLTKARWYATEASETHSKEDWAKAFNNFKQAKEMGEELLSRLTSGDSESSGHESSVLIREGNEITFADGVPLVPEICPVVILKGSDFEMGYQYARQLVDIFGPWILAKKANRKFTDEQLGYIMEWEKMIAKYAPEILSICDGWSAGATDAGVPMSYLDVLALWTGDLPPEVDYFGSGGPRMGKVPPLACSGVAAWGDATVDGKLVAGASGDFDATYTVTIVAFPETGNNFIFTPFGATGDVPLIGGVHLFGHPGMNNRGLAYVHHGGTPKMIEPQKYWGYGLRRTTSILHILRFASSAKEAREMELSYPIGDVGLDSGTVGGFYADSTYGYVLESRKDPVLIREAGLMGETDFLYSANSALHPEAKQAKWMQERAKNWRWHKNGGWYPDKFSFFNRYNMIYYGSNLRSRYFFDILNQGLHRIDFEYIKMIYRKSGVMPSGAWKKNASAWRKTGKWGEISGANASNGTIGIMKPDNGDQGRYAFCVGPGTRGIGPTSPYFASFNPVYGETNTFWELRLASSPEEVTDHSWKKAAEDIQEASEKLGELVANEDAAYQPLKDLLNRAEREFKTGEQFRDSAAKNTGEDAIYVLARATRAFTRAQVRARQVSNALFPPPRTPEDLKEIVAAMTGQDIMIDGTM
ncbi:MAG: hypothetical protein GTO14_12950 [Anaerolineales bacterium]|nr:hypothetical protein [Anaerolineales bacterium]